MTTPLRYPLLPLDFKWITAWTYPAIVEYKTTGEDDREWYWVWVYGVLDAPNPTETPKLTSHEKDSTEVHYDTDVESLSEQELIDTMYTIFTFIEKK